MQKSTIIDIITSILFDKITRISNASIAKEIINLEEKKGDAKLSLEIGSTVYEIHKEYVRGTKTNKITIKTRFFRIDESEEGKEIRTELTDEQRIKTNKHIENIIGTFETFCFFNFYLQQREMTFRELSNSKRKTFLYELYGYSFFEILEKKHKDSLKKLEMENKVYEEKHRKLSESDYDREEKALKEKYEQEKEKLKKEKTKIEGLDEKLSELNRSLIGGLNTNNMTEDIECKESEIKKCNSFLKLWENKFDENIYMKIYEIDVFEGNNKKRIAEKKFKII